MLNKSDTEVRGLESSFIKFRFTDLSSLLITVLDGSVGQLHAPAALLPENDYPYQLNMRRDGP
jgi:hypothetical protein